MRIRSRAAFAGAALSAVAALLTASSPGAALASSHREAPGITKRPKVDATDFYMFRSYEAGRANFVTVVACYQPLQAPYGGPNYFTMDPDALYEIHFDRDGDALEDLTFQFRFTNTQKSIALTVGPMGNQRTNEIPLKNAGAISAGNTASLNVDETYTLTMVTGDRRTGTAAAATHDGGQAVFTKPTDHIGLKSIPDYATYAATGLYTLDIPASATPGRVFVGQRKDPFAVNLGEIFDLVNADFDPLTPAFNPVGPQDQASDDLADANVTALCLELPIALLTNNGANPIVGGWTSASLRQARLLDPTPTGLDGGEAVHGGPWTQVSRLGMPLVNEVVIGLPKKDAFNASEPKDDAQFADYVTHPTLPELLEILFPGTLTAPNAFPRADLVQVFLTGVPGLNQPAGVVASEMLRLNTGIAPVPKGSQSSLGVLGADNAGFPNGRRPGDDVVDAALRVEMGVLLTPAEAPSGALPLVDGALVNDQSFDAVFPYLRTPLAGSPR
jgi:hypothetical protein